MNRPGSVALLQPWSTANSQTTNKTIAPTLNHFNHMAPASDSQLPPPTGQPEVRRSHRLVTAANRHASTDTPQLQRERLMVLIVPVFISRQNF